MNFMKLKVLLLSCLMSISCVYADTTTNAVQQVSVSPIVQPQNIAFENCSKMFGVNKETLFYLTLGAVTANNFKVEEIQSTNGYVIFTAANNKFLATIAGIDANNSILKITPCNDVYFFPPGVLLGMFKYIDLNLNTEIR